MARRRIGLNDALPLRPDASNPGPVDPTRLQCSDHLSAMSIQHARKGHAGAEQTTFSLSAVARHLRHVEGDVPVPGIMGVRLPTHLQQDGRATDARAGAAQRPQVGTLRHFNFDTGVVGLQAFPHKGRQLLQRRRPQRRPFHRFHHHSPPFNPFDPGPDKCQSACAISCSASSSASAGQNTSGLGLKTPGIPARGRQPRIVSTQRSGIASRP